MSNLDLTAVDTALAAVSDDSQRAAIRASVVTALQTTVQQVPPPGTSSPAAIQQAGVSSSSVPLRPPKWSLRNNFVKADLDLTTMKGEEFNAWYRQFSGFLTEAGFLEPHVTNEQRLLALEQCATRASYDKIQAIRLSLPTTDQGDIQKTLDALKASCMTDTNIWAARKTFRQRTQQTGEDYREYQLQLRQLSAPCAFGARFCAGCKQTANDEFLLHQLVFGVQDIDTQTDFLRSDKLTIDEATSIATKHESLRQAQTALNSSSQVAAFKVTCTNCGKAGHKARDPNCPALKSSCTKCGRQGHWQKCCRSGQGAPDSKSRGNRGQHKFDRSHGQHRRPPSSKKDGFPHTGLLINALSARTNSCSMSVTTSNGTCSLKGMIDTGSDWVAAGVQHLGIFHLRKNDLLPPTPDMCHTRTAGNGSLECVGYVEAEFKWNGKSTQDKVVFFKSFPNVLFSRDLLTSLGVVTIHEPTVSSPPSVNVTTQSPAVTTPPQPSRVKPTVSPPSCVNVTTQPQEATTPSEPSRVTPSVCRDQHAVTPAVLLPYGEADVVGSKTENLQQTSTSPSTTPSDFFANLLHVPSRTQLLEEFADVFAPRDQPMAGEPLHITLTEDAVPTRVTAARNVPLTLKDQLVAELEEQERNGLIRRVTQPTTWCAPIVVVPKKDPTKVRLAVDFRGLNKYIDRENFQSSPPLETIQSITSTDAKFFSTADAWKGYHQQRLDEESIDLTTFICPFNLGRWQYVRAPFGLSNISEVYDRQMTEHLQGLDNHRQIVDDSLIYSRDAVSHAGHVRAFLQRCRDKGIRLSEEKFVYMKSSVEFAGFELSADGYRIQDSVIAAIRDFPTPQDKTALRSFQGMANQLAPTNQELTKVLTPLRQLLKKDVEFSFDEVHQEAFIEAKRILTSPAVIAFYRPGAPLHLYTDASTLHGLGFVLKQKQTDGSWKPIQVGSRSLTDPEYRYAPIELELTGLVYAVSKARTFLAGVRHFTIFTDHKPLVMILNKRRLDEINNQRIVRLVLRLMDYNFTVEYLKGSENITADSLSRYPTSKPTDDDRRMSEQYATHVKRMCALHSSSADVSFRLQTVRTAAEDDVQYQDLKRQINSGFPDNKKSLPENLREFWSVHHDLTVADDGFILYGVRLLIPTSLRPQILEELHKGHRGIDGTRERARLVVYWPSIDRQIEQYCQRCDQCAATRPQQQREPLKHLPQPTRAWEFVSTDLFHSHGKTGICYTDWYTGWFCYSFPMESSDASHVIPTLRKWFADTSVPDVLFSDQGPPYSSAAFQDFLQRWGVAYQCSSAEYPQGNARAELAVKNCKALLDKYYRGRSTEWELLDAAIMQIRNTPHKSNNMSPAMLLYGRPVQDTLPAHKSLFSKDWHRRLRAADIKFARNQQRLENNYNRGTKELPPLRVGTPVAIYDRRTKRWNRFGVVQEVQRDLRRYVIRLASGMIVTRNRRAVRQRVQPDVIMPPIRVISTPVNTSADSASQREPESNDHDSVDDEIAAPIPSPRPDAKCPTPKNNVQTSDFQTPRRSKRKRFGVSRYSP